MVVRGRERRHLPHEGELAPPRGDDEFLHVRKGFPGPLEGDVRGQALPEAEVAAGHVVEVGNAALGVEDDDAPAVDVQNPQHDVEKGLRPEQARVVAELVEDELRALLDELDVHVPPREHAGAVPVRGADQPDDPEHVVAVNDRRADGKRFAADVPSRAARADEMFAGPFQNEGAPDTHDVAVDFAFGADVFAHRVGVEPRPGEAGEARVHDFHVHARHRGDELRVAGRGVPNVPERRHGIRRSR